MIYLYVKTHNKTGLKYLGKTTSKDPHKYKGSGLRWEKHLKVHGSDYTTEIIFQSDDPDEITKMGLYYSKLWDVVNDDRWANLKEESGEGGWPSREIIREGFYRKYGYTHNMKIPGAVDAFIEQSKRLHAEGKFKNNYFGANMEKTLRAVELAKTPEATAKKKQSLAAINHQQGTKNSQYGTMWITNGFENKKIKKIDKIPKGWYKGRVVKIK